MDSCSTVIRTVASIKEITGWRSFRTKHYVNAMVASIGIVIAIKVELVLILYTKGDAMG